MVITIFILQPIRQEHKSSLDFERERETPYSNELLSFLLFLSPINFFTLLSSSTLFVPSFPFPSLVFPGYHWDKYSITARPSFLRGRKRSKFLLLYVKCTSFKTFHSLWLLQFPSMKEFSSMMEFTIWVWKTQRWQSFLLQYHSLWHGWDHGYKKLL